MLEYLLNRSDEAGLPSYAIKSSSTKGRRYPEKKHPLRTPFQRDAARIIHSRPFRRLEYKTQVFLNGSGDHYRTRLTHTIEVSATARTIARTLNLNEDLTEAIALAHDLGHTPFGHIGEKVLNELLNPYGLNFEHNSHSLKIVDELVLKYPNFSGLNLCWETRTGLLKHRYPGITLDSKVLPQNLSLEAQAADIADDLTYYGHDIDDGIDSKLINHNELKKLAIWKKITSMIRKEGLSEGSENFIQYAVRTLIDYMVTDVIYYSNSLLKSYQITSPEEAQHLDKKIISFSPKVAKETSELKDFLYKNLYWNKHLNSIRDKTHNIIRQLFRLYLDHPEHMGKSANASLRSDGSNLHSVVSDYIAGMTDRFANLEYNKYFYS